VVAHRAEEGDGAAHLRAGHLGDGRVEVERGCPQPGEHPGTLGGRCPGATGYRGQERDLPRAVERLLVAGHLEVDGDAGAGEQRGQRRVCGRDRAAQVGHRRVVGELDVEPRAADPVGQPAEQAHLDPHPASLTTSASEATAGPVRLVPWER
jgi:hypothetical protein